MLPSLSLSIWILIKMSRAISPHLKAHEWGRNLRNKLRKKSKEKFCKIKFDFCLLIRKKSIKRPRGGYYFYDTLSSIKFRFELDEKLASVIKFQIAVFRFSQAIKNCFIHRWFHFSSSDRAFGEKKELGKIHIHNFFFSMQCYMFCLFIFTFSIYVREDFSVERIQLSEKFAWGLAASEWREKRKCWN